MTKTEHDELVALAKKWREPSAYDDSNPEWCAGLRECADELTTYLETVKLGVTDEDVELALQAHREHLSTSWDRDIPSAQFMAMREALKAALGVIDERT